MKLAILSDFHLGYEKFRDDALKQAGEAMQKACEKADALLLPGDLFDSRIPNQETIADALTMFSGINGKKWEAKASGGTTDKPIVAIAGTHERRSREYTNPVQVLEAAGLVNNAHAKKIVIEKNGEKVVVQGLNGIPEEYVQAALEKTNAQPVENAFNVFMFHQNIKEIMPAAVDALGIEEYPAGFQLYVDGHVHSRIHGKYAERELIVPGSTVITQMREGETERKGFFVYDTLERKAEFVEINSRPFVFKKISFDNSTPEEIKKKIAGELEKVDAKKGIVKLVVEGTLATGFSPSDVDLKELVGGEGSIIEIEKKLESQNFAQKVERLRSIREKKSSVRELGVEILKKNLEQTDSMFKGQEAEDLFAKLCEGYEEALEHALKKASKK